MQRKTSNNLPGFEYFVKGNNPRLLIHSGTHGDEFEVIDCVRKSVTKFETSLPDFVYVPVVSPSAVKNKTRLNGSDLDLNRVFFSSSKEPEVVENIKILKKFNFDLFVSFHEDPLSDEYYIYDSGFKKEESLKIKTHNEKLKDLGFKLLNGVDDPMDPDLGYEFIEGYRKFVETKGDSVNGMISMWSMFEKEVQTCLTPEIPGLLDIAKKQLIVDTFFSASSWSFFALESSASLASFFALASFTCSLFSGFSDC